MSVSVSVPLGSYLPTKLEWFRLGLGIEYFVHTYEGSVWTDANIYVSTQPTQGAAFIVGMFWHKHSYTPLHRKHVVYQVLDASMYLHR